MIEEQGKKQIDTNQNKRLEALTNKDAKGLQNMFKSNLNEISKGRSKSKKRRSALENIKLLYESRQTVIKLFSDYSSIVSEARHKVNYGEELKILSQQILQRLPIVLAKAKAGNTSENLLNEIRQIVYSLYRAKEITKKACYDIINSMKL